MRIYFNERPDLSQELRLVQSEYILLRCISLVFLSICIYSFWRVQKPRKAKQKKLQLPPSNLDDAIYIRHALTYLEHQYTPENYSSLEELLSLSSIPKSIQENICSYIYTWSGNEKDIRTHLETYIKK
jgi:hypothetical protein